MIAMVVESFQMTLVRAEAYPAVKLSLRGEEEGAPPLYYDSKTPFVKEVFLDMYENEKLYGMCLP